MIKNYFKTALRNLLRHKLFSGLNIFGLAAGMACSILIFLWVQDEWRKDKSFADSERIFHVVSNLKLQDGSLITWTITPGPLGEDIKANSPEVELAARAQGAGAMLFKYDEKSFLERGFYADPDFFKIFDFKILQGKPSTDPMDVSALSISQTLAKKLFIEI